MARGHTHRGGSESGLRVVLEGVVGQCVWALPAKRRIAGLLVGGDLHCGPLPSDHHRAWFTALTPCRVARLPWSQAERLAQADPAVGRALWRAAGRWAALQREWLRNDARPAEPRLAHRICEVMTRAGFALGPAAGVALPRLCQAVWADMTAMTPVHTNRCLQRMAAAGLIRVARGVVTVPDPARLTDFAGFDASYLQAGAMPPP